VLANLYADPSFLDTWWWSDECHVLLSGHVNRQNNRHLGWSKPVNFCQQPLHSQRVTVFCAMSKYGIIGPYFIEDDNGNPLIITSAIYKTQVIERFNGDLYAFCEMNGLDFGAQVFQ
jgi:hypothetical protein